VKLIVLEHQHGAGGTHHADALAASLERLGVAAVSYHHAPARTPDPYGAALHYATERHAVCRYVTRASVLVADRWHFSTEVVGYTMRQDALHALASAERQALPTPALVLVLDAPDAALDTRIEARGAVVTDVDRAARPWYRDRNVLRSWGAEVVDTSEPVAEVEARILARALAALGVRGWDANGSEVVG
jgi:thymidylate kinase